MQPYAQTYGYPPPAYGAPQPPINIVVQNTNMATATATAGGFVRVGNRSRLLAVLFAFFLGGLGVHKFYLGQPIVGLLYLLLSWTFIPLVIGFVEGVLLLFMSNHAFDMKYNARLT